MQENAPSPRLRRFLVTAAVLLLAVVESSQALAQVPLRLLPREAKRGELQIPAYPRMTIDGKTYAVAPGVKLRDANNVIIFAPMLSAPVTVRYTLDSLGAVDRVWILTPQEKSMPDHGR